MRDYGSQSLVAGLRHTLSVIPLYRQPIISCRHAVNDRRVDRDVKTLDVSISEHELAEVRVPAAKRIANARSVSSAAAAGDFTAAREVSGMICQRSDTASNPRAIVLIVTVIN